MVIRTVKIIMLFAFVAMLIGWTIEFRGIIHTLATFLLLNSIGFVWGYSFRDREQFWKDKGKENNADKDNCSTICKF